jgi:hypothetical protein
VPPSKAFPCKGDTAPLCSAFSWSLKDAAGRRLPILASKCGLNLADVGDIFLGAFSAGGGVLRDIFSSPEDRKRLRYVHNADATYSSRGPDGRPVINDWVVTWGAEVATGDGSQLWTATASPSANFGMPTGVETLQEIRRQIELRTGRQFEKLDSFYGIDPAPAAAYKLGNVIFAEYPMEPLAHGGHATILAKKVWQQIMWPWLDALRKGGGGGGGELPPVLPPGAEPEAEPWWKAAAFAAGGIVAYLILRWYRGRR